MSRPDARGAAAALAALLAAAGCGGPMASSGHLAPQDRSRFFADGQLARHPPDGTVARADAAGPDGPPAALAETMALPVPVTPALLARGRERFEIHCSVCHGRVGDGNGMVPARGFQRPPTYHSDRLRAVPDGHFYAVITKGYGAMPAYAHLAPADRWAITAYIRALQLSQHAPVAALPDSDRARLAEAPDAR